MSFRVDLSLVTGHAVRCGTRLDMSGASERQPRAVQQRDLTDLRTLIGQLGRQEARTMNEDAATASRDHDHELHQVGLVEVK
jgi:hypothetical protein